MDSNLSLVSTFMGSCCWLW